MNTNLKKYITFFVVILAQILSGSVVSLLTLTSTLIAQILSPLPSLASLPLTATVLGSALMVYAASLLMNQFGRRIAFMTGSFIGILGSVLTFVAVYRGSFALFIFGCFILGCAVIFNQYYRFAGAEIFNDSLKIKKATSLIIASGIVAGILGPFIATKGIYLFPQYPFLGTFVFCIFLFSFAFFVQIFIFIPKNSQNLAKTPKQNLKSILKSPYFLTSTLSCALAFAAMTLIMNATPLAMNHQHFEPSESAFVLQWHFVAMYAPALFLPFLVSKISSLNVVKLGILFFIIASLIGILLQDVTGYTLTLIFVGIGWSFMFSGGTFLLNENQIVSNKHQTQGLNSLFTYLCNLIASISVGFLINLNQGWNLINLLTLSLMLVFGILIIFKRNLA